MTPNLFPIVAAFSPDARPPARKDAGSPGGYTPAPRAIPSPRSSRGRVQIPTAWVLHARLALEEGGHGAALARLVIAASEPDPIPVSLCARCGHRQAERGRFCESCAELLAEVEFETRDES